MSSQDYIVVNNNSGQRVVLAQSNYNIIAEQIIGSVSSSVDTDLRNRTEIEALFKVAQATKYTEYTYSGGNLTKIEIWTDSGKGTKLFTQDSTYTGDDLTGITITDEVNSKTITKTFSYSLGNLQSKTEVYA